MKRSKTGDKAIDRANTKADRKITTYINFDGEFTLGSLQCGDIILLMRNNYHTINTLNDNLMTPMRMIQLYKDDVVVI